jgi:hypothetical protein
MLRTALRTVVAAALFLAPVVGQAQFDRTFMLCNLPQQFCAGIGMTLSGSTLTVGVRNNGSTPSADSFIASFGLFGGGITGGTMTSQAWVGSPSMPAGTTFASSGAPSDLQNGAGTQTLPIGADFGNNGLRPCGYGDNLVGGVRFETCDGEYGLFTFSLTGSSFDLASMGVAVRAQNLQHINGAVASADKCFSMNDANCRLTATSTIYGSPVAPAVVPEPSTYALLGFGLAALVGITYRRSA